MKVPRKGHLYRLLGKISMANTWFRMYTDFLNDPKVICLAFEDQRHFIGILALKSDGTIDQDCDSKLLDRIVSQRLWIDFSIINDVKKRLVDAGLIDSTWQPLAWEKRQFKSDKDSTAAERQRRYRESKNSNGSSNALCNETVTRLDTDTDTDTETTIDTNVSIVGNDESLTDQIAKDDQIPDCPHQEIISLYAKHLPMGIQPREWDGARASALKTRWREKKKRQSLDWWDNFFAHVAKSKFLTGKSTFKDGSTFEIQLPWILKSENFKKIIEGVYHKP